VLVNVFTGIKQDSIIRYQRVGFNTETYNRVSSVSADGLSMTVVGITSVSGVFDGSLPSSTIQPTCFTWCSNYKKSNLWITICSTSRFNISSVNLSDSLLTVSEQITGRNYNQWNVLTIDLPRILPELPVHFLQHLMKKDIQYIILTEIGTITSDHLF
jgi:hypothetical protein